MRDFLARCSNSALRTGTHNLNDSDIGDKKAIEKTSQALREGQPKLLQRIAARRQREAAQNAFVQLRTREQNHLPHFEPQSPVLGHASSSPTNSSLSAANFASISPLSLEKRRSELTEPMPCGLSAPFNEPIEPLPLGRLNGLSALSLASQSMPPLPPPTVLRGGAREVTPASAIKAPVSPAELLQQYDTNDLLAALIDRLQQR